MIGEPEHSESSLTGLMQLRHRLRRKARRSARDLYRFHLRRKVAFSAPSPMASRLAGFAPNILVCHHDLLLGVCSAKTLNLVADEALPWVFHDDGSLTPADGRILARHFPGCRVVRRSESDTYFESVRDRFPSVYQGRRRHVMLLKLADLSVYSDMDRILSVDSDILFFREPHFLLSALDRHCVRNYFNRDLESAYISSREDLWSLTGTAPLEAVNAGLSVLNRGDIVLEKIEEVLRMLEVSFRAGSVLHSHLIEQTAVAILATRGAGGAAHLPSEYDVSLEKPVDSAVCKHYVGVIRHEYELEGLRFLIDKMRFFERWSLFARRG